MIKKQFEKERINFTLQLLGSQGRHSRQELTQRNVAYWLAPHAFLGLLSYTTQNYLPRGGTGHSAIGPSKSITNQETVPEISLKVNLEEAFFFFQLESPVPIYFSSLCQIHIKLAHTEDPAARTPQSVAREARDTGPYMTEPHTEANSKL